MKASILARVITAVVVSATAVNAQIVGTFNGAGSLNATGQPGVGQPVTLTFVAPQIVAVPTLNGIFAPIAPGTVGIVQTITVGEGVFNVPNFIQIAGYNFSLDFVAPGTFSPAQCFVPAAPGQTCSPPGTPFNLSNLSNGSGGINTSAAFNVSGTVTTPSSAQYAYDGIFTSQFTGVSYQTLIAAINAGQAVPVSYSLNVIATTSSVPEPATLTLVAAGVLLLGGAVARRRRLD
jgi:hypothetical protein